MSTGLHKPQKPFIERLKTFSPGVIAALLGLFASLYTGYAEHKSRLLEVQLKSTTAVREYETTVYQKILDEARAIRESQNKKIDDLQNQLNRLTADVDLWRERYYSTLEERNLLKVQLLAVQTRFDSISQEFESLKQKWNNNNR